MTRFYLIRHMQAEGNVFLRVNGWYDAGVTQMGLRQLAALTGRFEKIHVDAVYSSDLYRCLKTAEAIYKPKNLPLYLEPGMRELGVGIWENRPFAEVCRKWPDQWNNFNLKVSAYLPPEGGESFHHLQARAVEAILRIAGKHPNETVAVVSHSIAIRAVLSWFRGFGVEGIREQPASPNTGVTCLDWDGKKAHILFEADGSHLPREIISADRFQAPGGQPVLPGTHSLWFRPWNPETERGLFYNYRHEAWIDIHGTGEPFHGDQFYKLARASSLENQYTVMVAMHGDESVGMIQMDPHKNEDEGVCFVPFCYMDPEHRHKGLGVQLLGQAVATARIFGRCKLRLRCAPTNHVAERFYTRNGFRYIGMAQDSAVKLELLEKDFMKDDGSTKLVLD